MHDAKLYVRAAFYEQRVEQKYTGLHISLLKEQIFQQKATEPPNSLLTKTITVIESSNL